MTSPVPVVFDETGRLPRSTGPDYRSRSGKQAGTDGFPKVCHVSVAGFFTNRVTLGCSPILKAAKNGAIRCDEPSNVEWGNAGPGRPDEDTRGGFTHGGWAQRSTGAGDAAAKAMGERLAAGGALPDGYSDGGLTRTC